MMMSPSLQGRYILLNLVDHVFLYWVKKVTMEDHNNFVLVGLSKFLEVTVMTTMYKNDVIISVYNILLPVWDCVPAWPWDPLHWWH